MMEAKDRALGARRGATAVAMRLEKVEDPLTKADGQ